MKGASFYLTYYITDALLTTVLTVFSLKVSLVMDLAETYGAIRKLLHPIDYTLRVDLMAVLEERVDFISLLIRKKRHASQTGEIYLPAHKLGA